MPNSAKKFPHFSPHNDKSLAQDRPRSQLQSSALTFSGVALSLTLLAGACSSSESDPTPTDGTAPTTTVESPTEPAPTTAPTTDTPTDEPTTDGPLPDRSVVWEPVCGETWDPPELPLMEGRNFELSVEDYGDDLWLSLEGDLHNLGPQWDGAYYTWPVVTQDDVIVSPMLLGSDAIFDVSLEPMGSVSVSGEHSLTDFCGPTRDDDQLAPGDYSVYLLVLDIAAYNSSEERAVIAVFDSIDFTMDEDSKPVIP